MHSWNWTHHFCWKKKKKKKKPFLELSQKRSWLELRRAREKQKGDRCFSSMKLAAAELPPSSSLRPLTLRVSLFIASHQLERSQSTAHTQRHAHTKTEWEDQKVKGRRREPNEHWRGSLKTSREGWGSEKGTNMLDWKKGKGLEKRHWRKSTYDANGGIHSTLSSQGHICQYKLCLRRKWKHKEAENIWSAQSHGREDGDWTFACKQCSLCHPWVMLVAQKIMFLDLQEKCYHSRLRCWLVYQKLVCVNIWQ